MVVKNTGNTEKYEFKGLDGEYEIVYEKYSEKSEIEQKFQKRRTPPPDIYKISTLEINFHKIYEKIDVKTQKKFYGKIIKIF